MTVGEYTSSLTSSSSRRAPTGTGSTSIQQSSTACYRPTTTSPLPLTPKPAAFLEAFRHAGSEADSVVCVTLSAGFSATYQSARSAAIMAEAEGTHVVVVDSGAAAGAAGLMALEAARTAQSGGSTEDVVSRVEDLIPRVNLLAFLDTLYYLRRSGRVPLVAAWASSLLGIKPLTELKHGRPGCWVNHEPGPGPPSACWQSCETESGTGRPTST